MTIVHLGRDIPKQSSLLPLITHNSLWELQDRALKSVASRKTLFCLQFPHAKESSLLSSQEKDKTDL